MTSAGLSADFPLDARDQQIARESHAAATKGIKLIDDVLLLLNHGTAVLSGQKHDRDFNFLTGLLVLRAFNSIWRARQDAVDGYAVQSLILARAALEDWAAVRWLEENPDEKNLFLSRMIEGVLVPRDARDRERWIPAVDVMLKGLPDGVVPLLAYQHLSKLAHPNGVGLGWQFHFDVESAYVHCGPRFDKRDLDTCLYFLAHVAGGFLPCVERLQVRWLGKADAEWIERGAVAAQRCLAFIAEFGPEFREPPAE